MSHSLRAKIKCLRYKGIITDKDCDRLRKALDNEDVFDKIRADVINIADSRRSISVRSVINIIDKYRKEQE